MRGLMTEEKSSLVKLTNQHPTSAMSPPATATAPPTISGKPSVMGNTKSPLTSRSQGCFVLIPAQGNRVAEGARESCVAVT